MEYDSAALRGLIKFIVFQPVDLVSHVRERLDNNRDVFQGRNAALAARQALTSILESRQMKGAIICIDALDECGGDLGHLLELITRKCDVK